MRRECSSSSPRFSRTFDRLLSQFPDSIQTSTLSSNMASSKGGYQSSTWNEQSAYKPAPWRSTVSAPSCALCQKPVFPAEEVNGAGQKYHKLCLKCSSCNTLLNSGNVNEHDKKIYCTGCYRRQFGPHGIGRGLGTTLSTNLETPPSSPRSSRIGSESNEELMNTDNGYSSNSSQSRVSPDNDLRHSNSQMNSVTYIGGVTTRQTLSTPPRPVSSSITNGTAFKMMSISGNICPRCSKTVYSAEEVKAAGKSFHKRCYTCAHCNKSINAARYSEHEGELYDNNCYQRLFGPKGVGYGIGSGTLSTAM